MDDFRSILVHLDSSSAAADRLLLASLLAQRHEAELTGLYAVSSVGDEFVFTVAGDTASLVRLRKSEEDKCASARAQFNGVTAGLQPRPSWAELALQHDQELARRIRFADLLVLGQFEPGSETRDGLTASFVPSAIMDSGRPALIVPFKGAPVAYPRVAAVAWKNTRESAHAVRAALPMLLRCEVVHVAQWEEAGDDVPEDSFGIDHFFELHGVHRIVHRKAATRDPGEALLSFVAEVSADLLVMGCFGHWRAREWAFGGVTRSILRSMTIPVLMAH